MTLSTKVIFSNTVPCLNVGGCNSTESYVNLSDSKKGVFFRSNNQTKSKSKIKKSNINK